MTDREKIAVMKCTRRIYQEFIEKVRRKKMGDDREITISFTKEELLLLWNTVCHAECDMVDVDICEVTGCENCIYTKLKNKIKEAGECEPKESQ